MVKYFWKNRISENRIWQEECYAEKYSRDRKIIANLAVKDYSASINRLTAAQRKNIATQKKTLADYGGVILGEKTREAMEIRDDYLQEKITEEEFKAWCLKYNLTA